MNGTARSTAPGTRVATVTGIQTCCARRSICSISSRCTSRRIDRASSAMSRPRSPASRLSDSTPTSRSRASTSASVAHSRSASTSDEALTDAAAHAGEVLGAGARAAGGEPVERAAERVARHRGACRAARSPPGSSRKMRRFQRSDSGRELLLDDRGTRAPGRRATSRSAMASGGWVAAATSAPDARSPPRPPELPDPEGGGVHRRVRAREAHRRGPRSRRASAASRSPTWRASGPMTSRNDATDRTPPLERRLAERRPGRRAAAGRRAAGG